MTATPARLRLHSDPVTGQSTTGSQAAWREQLTGGLDALYRYVYFRVGMDAHVAEDILQQTACAALQYERPPECDEEKQWLLRGIAMNLIRKHWRSMKHQAESMIRTQPQLAQNLLRRMEQPVNGEVCTIRDEERHQLLLAVSALATDEQWLLYAFYKCGRSRAHIAEELGVSPQSVETRLYRMRNRLREVLLDLTQVE